jgi:hypothetical protein
MLNEEDDLRLIQTHYDIAFALIKYGNLSKAKYELFSVLPLRLYDKSLDIMDDRNSGSDQSLKNLIKKVHKKLNDTNEECDGGVIPDIKDIF